MSVFLVSTAACVALLQLFLLQLATAKEYSWCDPDLCGPGIKHVACRNNGVREFYRITSRTKLLNPSPITALPQTLPAGLV